MPIKFYASIPAAYITPDLPPGRYLVSAAKLWDARKKGFRWDKLDCLTPSHEILIDSGGFSFNEYPDGYIKQYHFAADIMKADPELTPPWEFNFFQIDRIGDYDFTARNRTPYTVPIIRAECGDITHQFHELPAKYQFFAVGGLKKLKPFEAAAACFEAIIVAQHEKVRHVHLLGVGLKIIKYLKTWEQKGAGPYNVEISCDSGSWNTRFGPGIDEFNEVMKENGWTQRETAVRHFLPKYRKAIEE